MEKYSFGDLNISSPLLKALDDMGLKYPTTIQYKAFPVVMSGKDMIGIAQTGTGKTLAFLLPCIRQWSFSKKRTPQILIIVPTRELVVQIVEQVDKLCAYLNVVSVGVYGGANIRTQAETISLGLDVLVATPGRLFDLVLAGDLSLKDIKKLVIDEVDELFHLGFRPQLLKILELLPEKKQSLLFSATMNEEVETLLENYFIDPVKVEAAPPSTPLETIDLKAYQVPNFNTKLNLLSLLLDEIQHNEKTLIFVSSKQFADLIYQYLEPSFENKVSVIHSNKSQNARFEAVKAFQEGRTSILIATDVISRGIDISNISTVINFEAPEDFEHFIHRVGRTGRAEKKGLAINLFSKFEQNAFNTIQNALGEQKMEVIPNPTDLELSEQLIEEEMPKPIVPNVPIQKDNRVGVGAAFHEKSDKNKKVNVRKNWKKIKQEKYGKPKSKGKKRK